jgi:transcriptional regulator with XRE-family HTH domain
MSRTLLDGELIHRRRIQLGLSERELAKRLGTGGAVVRGLVAGTNQEEQPIKMLAALAEVLAVSFDELFGRVQPVAAAGKDTAAPAADAAAVGALLGTDGRLVPMETLADALGWSVDRVRAALRELAERLPAAGLRLHLLNGSVSIVPAAAAVGPVELQRLSRAVLSRRGLKSSSARVLHQACTGVLDTGKQGNAERVALAGLVNAGLLTVPSRARQAEQPEPTADVRFSLLLDEEPQLLRAGGKPASRRAAPTQGRRRAARSRPMADPAGRAGDPAGT